MPLRSPRLQLSLAGAASRGRTLVPAAALQLHRLRHFSSASVRSPSAPGVPARPGAAKKRSGRSALERTGGSREQGRSAVSQLPGRAGHPASAALPFRGRGPSAPTGARLTPAPPHPPQAGRIQAGARTQGPPSGCPMPSLQPLPGVGTSPRRHREGDSSLWHGCCGARGASSVGA